MGHPACAASAQVLSARPDLTIASLRGNVDTRLRKALDGQYHAVILAGAGLARLGLEAQVTQWLPFDVMLPAPGQGALAVQCRADDKDTLALLSVLEDPSTRAAVTAERQFLLGLGGGCALPVAAYASEIDQQSAIRMTGLVASTDGQQMIKVFGQGTDPYLLGERLAQEAIIQGASEILELNVNR